MNIGDIMDELGAAINTIADLRVLPYSSQRITPPAAIVGWPSPYTFDSAMARGADSMDFPINVVVGQVDSRSSRDRMSKYVDGSGPDSIKAALEGHTYTDCDSVRVTRVEFSVVKIAEVEYLSGLFTVNVIGRGA